MKILIESRLCPQNTFRKPLVTKEGIKGRLPRLSKYRLIDALEAFPFMWEVLAYIRSDLGLSFHQSPF
jgi:hypothetical protein